MLSVVRLNVIMLTRHNINVMLSVIRLNVVMLTQHNDTQQNGPSYDTQHNSIERHHVECRYAEYRDYINVTLSVVLLNVVMRNVIMLSVIRLNDVLLSVVTPPRGLSEVFNFKLDRFA
jgi:hypothetical protein